LGWVPPLCEILNTPLDGRGGVYGGKDLRKRYLLSLEWKRVRVVENDSGDDETDELRELGNGTGSTSKPWMSNLYHFLSKLHEALYSSMLNVIFLFCSLLMRILFHK